jgi:hypothetical protein
MSRDRVTGATVINKSGHALPQIQRIWFGHRNSPPNESE